jgi:hypothetical protein
VTNPPDPHDPLVPYMDFVFEPANARVLFIGLLLILLGVGLLLHARKYRK